MQFLPDGTCYEDDPINLSDEINIGDDLVCVLISKPPMYPEIHKRVITVDHISETGGIKIRGYSDPSHFVRRCFHKIIEKENALEGFDEAFQ